MKGLFKAKPRTPTELVRHLDNLLSSLENNTTSREHKREEKMMSEVNNVLLEIRTALYGTGESEPNPDACAQITTEFFRGDTFRRLIVCLPKLNLGARQDAIRVIANLQRQRIKSKSIASEYLEKNLDLIDILIPGYEDDDIALTYGTIARELICHQVVARYVMGSEIHMKKFFSYLQNPNFEIESDVTATFKELLTRHKSSAAEFLSRNYDWFFQEYNTQLLESPTYITRRHAIKLLADVLLDRANTAVMVRYVSSLHNMKIMMKLLRESNKTIQFETFHVFKLFVANQNKPPEIVSTLVTNRSKLLRFLGEFSIEKEDEQFEEDKAQVIREISILEPGD